MTKWVTLLKQYKLIELIRLVSALSLDLLHKHIPKSVFQIKNTYDYVINHGGKLDRDGNESSILFNEMRYRLRLSGSDFLVFDQIVIGKGMQRIIDKIKLLGLDNSFIMDCGANIGLSTLVLKKELPASTILCVEPEIGNYQQLMKNIQINDLRDVIAVNKGVWYEGGRLKLSNEFRDKSNWAFKLEKSAQADENVIEVDTIQALAQQNGFPRIDVLKIDIEGSEFALFRNLDKWQEILNTVRIVSIEPHEECGETNELIEILRCNNFSVEYYQELIIGTRL